MARWPPAAGPIFREVGGQILATFIGRLQAAGIIMPTISTSGFADIVWRRDQRDNSGLSNMGVIHFTDNGNTDFAEIDLLARPNSTTDAAKLFLISDESGLVKTRIGVRAGNPASLGAAGYVAVILDDTGVSDFARQETIDTGVITINGGLAVAANGAFTITVGHTLGVVPDMVSVVRVGGGTLVASTILDVFTARTTTSVTVQLRFVNGGSAAAGATSRWFISVLSSNFPDV